MELVEEKPFIHHVMPLSVVNIDLLIYNPVGLSSIYNLHEVLKLYRENKKVAKTRNKTFKLQTEIDQYTEEYKQMRISKLIPFSIFIDNCFHKQNL